MGSVYMLHSKSTNKTYVGASKDIARRLRQHRGELQGGARQTSHSNDWTLVLQVDGFGTWNQALCFEFSWRRANRKNRRYDVRGRCHALEALLLKQRWSKNAPEAADIPLTIHWKCTEFQIPFSSIGDIRHLTMRDECRE